MMMKISENPIADFETYDAEQQLGLRKLPKCCLCSEYIQQEEAVRLRTIYGNYWICDGCLEDSREEIEVNA